MSIKTFITDIANGLKAKVNNANGTEESALVVATRPLKELTTKFLFFFNPTYGVDMNKTPGAAGTPINIHNGIDNVYWTGSNITGTNFDFNSNTEAHTGTYSIDASSTDDNDEAEFAKGARQDLTGYTSISGWIYITGWPTTGTKEVQIYGRDSIYLIDSTGYFLVDSSADNFISIEGGQVGNIVDIGDYVDTNVFNTWQRFNIPLLVMGLTNATIDSIRIKTISLGAGAAPSYYLDDIRVEETAVSIQYTVEPTEGTWLYVDALNIAMADALDSTLANASMPNLSYDKLLGATLTNGITFQIFEEGSPITTNKFHGILDFLSFPRKNIINSGGDGTNTWLNLNLTFLSPKILKSEKLNKIVITVEDDLSVLLYLRMSLSCREEIRQ